jgi:hypothetical protein
MGLRSAVVNQTAKLQASILMGPEPRLGRLKSVFALLI